MNEDPAPTVPPKKKKIRWGCLGGAFIVVFVALFILPLFSRMAHRDFKTRPKMKGTENFRGVASYAEVSKYIDGDFNHPKVPGEMSQEEFAAEFNSAHDVIIKYLSKIGKVTEDSDRDADFDLYRYVDLRRAINVVCGKFDPEVVFAIQKAQKELPVAYAINLDSHPAYVSILPSGEVLGFSKTEEGQEILDQYGFPR